jgi:hypothetical protein
MNPDVAAQLARKRTRVTLRSYSASTCRVISRPSAANTRPPFRRHVSRSYWHGPISGCRRQSASTFGANSIAVERRCPPVSVMQTYSAPGGISVGISAGARGASVDGWVATGGAGCGASIGRRTTATPASFVAGGAGGPAHATTAVASAIAQASRGALGDRGAIRVCLIRVAGTAFHRAAK